MKRWLYFIFISLGSLCPGLLRAATPTLVQHVSHSSAQGNAVTSYLVRLPNQTLANNCVIVSVSSSASGSIPTVTDDKSTVYTQLATQSDGNQRATIFAALNVLPGAQAITVHFAAATTFVSAMASEFFNVATASALDGFSSNIGSATTITAGSFTPTVNGDLIYQFALQDSPGGTVTSFTQGASPWALLSADVLDSTVAQYQVQTTAAAINPTLTMAPANSWVSAAIALKSASAGTPPTGMYVQHLQHNAFPVNPTNPKAWSLQFPCTGNLLVASWIGVATYDITSITSNPANTWTQIGLPFGNVDSGDSQMFHADSATCTTTMTVTVNTTGTDISGSTLQLFDIVGAAASPFDSTAGRASLSGSQAAAGNFSGCTINPTTPNGMVISSLGVANNTINAVSGGGALFLSSVTTPETSPWPNDENNGWAIIKNASATSTTFTWTSTGGGAGNWASIAAAFEAAGGAGSPAFSGSVSPTSATISVGSSQQFTVQVNSLNNFQGSVALSCVSPPAGISCQFAPASVPLTANASSSSTLTVSVTQKPASFPFLLHRIWPKFWAPLSLWKAFSALLAILLILFHLYRRSQTELSARLVRAATVGLLAGLALAITSCSGAGGGGGGGTPVTKQISVQGTSGNSTVAFGTLSITVP